MLRLMPHPLQFAFQSAGPLPARSLSCRLCRDASSPLPPSSDVGKFIRGAAFPTARAGLRRPQMRSAALFRPSDGFSARPGNVAAPCGGVHSGSGNEPPARSLSDRLCRDASSSLPPSPDVGEFIRGAAFPIARAGLRRPQMRSAAEYSRPAALFRAPDGLSARPGMSPPRAAGGIPAPATNRPRGACPVGFAGTHRLLSRLLRMSENSSGGTAFPIARAGLRCPQMRPAALFRPSDGFSARPGMSPPRAAGGAFRLRQRTARAAQPRRSDAPGRRSCDRTALRKPPPRPDASRSPEARSSHGRSPPLSPESCGTPAPCGCSPVRKRLRTKHRGAV